MKESIIRIGIYTMGWLLYYGITNKWDFFGEFKWRYFWAGNTLALFIFIAEGIE